MSNAPLHKAAHRLRHTVAPWLTRQRISLQRDTRRQRIVSIVLTVAAALVYLVAVVNLQRTNTALGARSLVYIAVNEVRPGDTLTAAMVHLAEHPRAFIPPTALTETPLGKTARQHVMPGEHFTSTNVHATSEHHVPPGWRIVAITVRAALPPLEAGAHVDVIARAEVLVAGAIVVSVGEAGRAAMIAVPAASAALVATEAALGEATLAAG